MSEADPALRFQAARPMLLGLAYRILGSRADAEDAVQDTFLKWQANERGDIVNAEAWLTTACTRHCLDLLKAADRARVDYVGTWLPEPVQTAGDATGDDDPSRAATLASSLTTAFLLALQRLTPKERAAYLLHEIFDRPYPEVAATLELQEPACRQLVTRARQHIGHERVRHDTPPARQRRLLDAFREAISTGSTAVLATLLSDDVRLSSDGGGKVTAARRVMRGPGEVLRFIEAGLHIWWPPEALVEVPLNGEPGFVVRDGDGIVATVSFAWNDAGQLQDVFIMRNPDKLARVGGPAIH
ncbi:RNA polymerase subunit sigma-24 [Pseudoxanthomonas yeongjuensis]|uniref:RNA polymerase sigma factor SigJ n=1 Tax=Pseudoxanthomonas yeongjuensis TaxID=377616 RepID=UPI0013918B50|nr:RNA polymerase sigma factor SigJ [Pseudoxanthomonas yeongjuensis]KAF1718012.1 RNA polymerase subunit sigma-24 [Pseudoxanthomonas yeongjuensis]